MGLGINLLFSSLSSFMAGCWWGWLEEQKPWQVLCMLSAHWASSALTVLFKSCFTWKDTQELMSTLDSRDQSAGGYKLHREITPQISISSLLITVSELLLKAQSNNKNRRAWVLFYFPQEKLRLFYSLCACSCFLFKVCVLHCTWKKWKFKFSIGLKILYILKGSATFITVTVRVFPFKILKGGVKHPQADVRRSGCLQWHLAMCRSWHKWCQAPLADLCGEHLHLDEHLS